MVKVSVRFSIILVLTVVFAHEVRAQLTNYVFERLGEPIRSSLPIAFATRDDNMGSIAWGGLTDAERNMLVGVNMDTGHLITVDLTPFGKSNAVLLFKGSERYIYIYAGQKGRFFKYDIHSNTLTNLGGESQARYWLKTSYARTPDGKIYVGTYPQAEITVLDTHTDEVELLGRISSSAGTEYVIGPAASADGILYFPTGMQHGELWTLDPKTKKKKQLLPDSLMTYGPPEVWVASDGKVYGKKGKINFLCTPDGIIIGRTEVKAAADKLHETTGKTALWIDRDGYLEMEDRHGKRSKVKSKFKASAHQVFSIGDSYAGKLYGSGMKPGHVFTYDIRHGDILDLGKITRGGVQVYDILSYGNKLFMSSYTGGYIDCFDVSTHNTLSRYKPVAHLHALANQERAVQLVLGKDGMIYTPTIPIKGYLGGALVQINPKSFKTKIFKELIHHQSYTSVTSIAATGELFITSSIQGGTSAKPTAKEAFVFLWDPKTERITFKGQPIKGSNEYGKAVMACNGMIYGAAADKLYAFDPIKRKVVFQAKLEAGQKEPAKIVLSDRVGECGLVYGVDTRNGRLFSINPVNNQVVVLAIEPSLINSNFAAMREGYLYYANQSRLMRVRLE